MLINPVLVIAAAAVILCIFIFCIINKPAKPLFTGTSIVMLIVFLIFTAVINLSLSSSSGDSGIANVANAVTGFLTGQSGPTSIQLEQSFQIFAYIDIGLILTCVLSMIIEVRRIFSITSSR